MAKILKRQRPAGVSFTMHELLTDVYVPNFDINTNGEHPWAVDLEGDTVTLKYKGKVIDPKDVTLECLEQND